jgi:UDP-3-O-[3-hydroxymyristoyl] glucosamine N-acyltransferase
MAIRLGQLAVRFGCTLKGDADIEISSIASLASAQPGSITFLANPKLHELLKTTRASAVILDAKTAEECPRAALIAQNPHVTFAHVAALLYPVPTAEPGIHPSAVVGAGARIDPSASIGPQCVIEAGVVIHAGTVLGPGCIVMAGSSIGAHSRFVARVTVCRGVSIGQRCIVHPGAVIGGDGFGLAPDRGTWVKVPQVGGVVIGDDVEIGSNTTIDRGALEDTIIEEGVKLDNQIQIGHNVRIGAHTAIAACVGISGSTTIGKRCMIGGQVGISGHLTVCDDVVLTGQSMVAGDIRKPGYYSSALAVEESGAFRKNAARFYQLDKLARDVIGLKRARSKKDSDAGD